MIDAASAISRRTDPDAKVSAHYLVAEDGEILRMVEENKRAWHAGLSFWRGITYINSASIGIEIVNPGHEYGNMPYPNKTMDAIGPPVNEIGRGTCRERESKYVWYGVVGLSGKTKDMNYKDRT